LLGQEEAPNFRLRNTPPYPKGLDEYQTLSLYRWLRPLRVTRDVGVAELIKGNIMKSAIKYMCLILLVSLGVCSCRNSAPRDLIGISRADLITKLGEPSQIVNATYEYPDQGLSVIVLDEKVLQYVIKRGSGRQTDLGVKIGTPMSEVTSLYGEYKKEEEVKKWFAGDEPDVLYHHAQNDKYKINYPGRNLTFMFDGNKNVEAIWVGFPPRNTEGPQPIK
jgi:hypothetical protein